MTELQLGETAQKAWGLLSLTDNWDSYGAPPISRGHVCETIILLEILNTPTLPPPSVCPTNRRGVCMEWASADGDIAIEVTVDGDGTEFYAEDNSPSAAPEEISMSPLETMEQKEILKKWLVKLS